MKLMIDTNVLIDVLAKREPFYMDSLRVLELCESVAQGSISSLSIMDTAYIMRKELDQNTLAQVLDKIKMILNIEDLSSKDIFDALTLDMPDFEDATIASCGVRIKADYIVTRNIIDFQNSPVEAVTPAEILKVCKKFIH